MPASKCFSLFREPQFKVTDLQIFPLKTVSSLL